MVSKLRIVWKQTVDWGRRGRLLAKVGEDPEKMLSELGKLSSKVQQALKLEDVGVAREHALDAEALHAVALRWLRNTTRGTDSQP